MNVGCEIDVKNLLEITWILYNLPKLSVTQNRSFVRTSVRPQDDENIKNALKAF